MAASPAAGGLRAGRLGVMSRYRDVAAFDERSAGYEQGWLGRAPPRDR